MGENWIGVIVKESLKDMSVLDIDYVGVIEQRQKELGISGIWTVLEVMVEPEDFEKVKKLLKKGLKPHWYAYFKRGDRVMIIFKDKVFNIKKDSKRSLTRVKNWAFKHHNILPEVFTLDV